MSDKGPGNSAIVIGADPEKRVVILAFHMKTDRAEFSPEQARDIASMLVSRAAIADGSVPPPDHGKLEVLRPS